MNLDYRPVVVIGLGFGDEGKGFVTNYLVRKRGAKGVCRFSGGHQAGHMVWDDGRRHIFSNYGSGSLHGANTVWTKYCTIHPPAILKERKILRDELHIHPTIFIDPECPVTTPFDIAANQGEHMFLGNKDGTCGVGFGRTIQREEDHYHLLAGDLMYDYILREKLKAIGKYYGGDASKVNVEGFIRECTELQLYSDIIIQRVQHEHRMDVVYEGSQGLLLDQKHGFFPHVTRSHTDLTNLREMDVRNPHVYLVTRAYHTRHGNGPLINEGLDFPIKSNPNETNEDNDFQGKFRKSMLDIDLLNYAVHADRSISMAVKTLVITCIDHLSEFKYTMSGQVHECSTAEAFVAEIREHLKTEKVLVSGSEDSRLLGAW